MGESKPCPLLSDPWQIVMGDKNKNMATNISTIKINAPIQKAWDTITKPELVKLWQYGSSLLTTWEVGSDIKFRTEWKGKVFEQWGKVFKRC